MRDNGYPTSYAWKHLNGSKSAEFERLTPMQLIRGKTHNWNKIILQIAGARLGGGRRSLRAAIAVNKSIRELDAKSEMIHDSLPDNLDPPEL